MARFPEKNFIDYEMCLIFYTISVWSMFYSKKKWARYYNKFVLGFMWSGRYSCHILMKLEFFNRFSNNSQTSNSLKIPSLGTELFRVDEQMDRYDGPIVAFRNFSKTPKHHSVSALYGNNSCLFWDRYITRKLTLYVKPLNFFSVESGNKNSYH